MPSGRIACRPTVSKPKSLG